MTKRKNHLPEFKAKVALEGTRVGMFVFNEIKLFKAFMKEDQMIMINRKYMPNPDYDQYDLFSADFRAWYAQFLPEGEKDQITRDAA